jgi:hypothetical protein
MAKLIKLAEVRRRKMVAQYVAFYGNAHDDQRKATK